MLNVVSSGKSSIMVAIPICFMGPYFRYLGIPLKREFKKTEFSLRNTVLQLSNKDNKLLTSI